MRHTGRTPSTLTDAEIKALLDGTGRSADDLRDHMIFAVALGTGLRVSELCALNVGDVKNGKGAKGVWVLRPETTKGGRGGEIALPERLRRKVAAYLGWKAERGEALTDDAPLFVSRGGGRGGARGGGRLSPRSAQHAFAEWQRRTGFDRHLNFHTLRHTFATALWRSTGDLRLVQAAARHANAATSSIYVHATTEDVLAAVQNMRC